MGASRCGPFAIGCTGRPTTLARTFDQLPTAPEMSGPWSKRQGSSTVRREGRRRQLSPLGFPSGSIAWSVAWRAGGRERASGQGCAAPTRSFPLLRRVCFLARLAVYLMPRRLAFGLTDWLRRRNARRRCSRLGLAPPTCCNYNRVVPIGGDDCVGLGTQSRTRRTVRRTASASRLQFSCSTILCLRRRKIHTQVSNGGEPSAWWALKS